MVVRFVINYLFKSILIPEHFILFNLLIKQLAHPNEGTNKKWNSNILDKHCSFKGNATYIEKSFAKTDSN